MIRKLQENPRGKRQKRGGIKCVCVGGENRWRKGAMEKERERGEKEVGEEEEKGGESSVMRR